MQIGRSLSSVLMDPGMLLVLSEAQDILSRRWRKVKDARCFSERINRLVRRYIEILHYRQLDLCWSIWKRGGLLFMKAARFS